MWEIFTRGGQPYQGVQNLEIQQYLERGRRLAKPDRAPHHMYAQIEAIRSQIKRARTICID